MEIGPFRPKSPAVRATENATGLGALVVFENGKEYAQFTATDHKHAYGWWEYDAGSFTELKDDA